MYISWRQNPCIQISMIITLIWIRSMISTSYMKLKVDTTCGSGLLVVVKATLPHHDANQPKGLMSWTKKTTISSSFRPKLVAVHSCAAAKLREVVPTETMVQSSTSHVGHRSTPQPQSRRLRDIWMPKSRKCVKANTTLKYRVPMETSVGVRFHLEGVA